MNRWLTLAPLLATTLLPSASPAAEPAAPAAPKAIVEKELLAPLAAKERVRSRFSRARMPAEARRVRVLDAEPQKDADGQAFLKFSVDARYGLAFEDDDDKSDGWHKDTITGCVYPETSTVFVLRSGAYYPGASLLGKKTKAASEHTCVAAPAEVTVKDAT